MILGIDHAGFVVANLEISTSFYRDVIGLPVVREIERKGSPISQDVGYRDVHLKASLLDLGDGKLLELIEYVMPVADDRPTFERAVIGGSHLAFRVQNISETLEIMTKNGAKKLNEPSEVAPSRFACYLQDPDGNWLEFIEDTSAN